MSWVFDYIPWWVYPIVFGGGGVALFFLVPGVAAFMLSVYNALPAWARWLIGGAIVAFLAFIRGRNIGRRNADEAQRKLDDRARNKAKEVTDHGQSISDKQVDDELEKSGGFWDDPPSRGGRPRHRG